MPVNGKAKGGEFERQCCRRLSRWVSNGTRDDLFWRSATSGGRATFQLKQGIVNQTQAGDLTAIDPLAYPFATRCLFECKNYKHLQIAEGLIKKTGSLYSFWDRVVRDGITFGKEPVLIAKQNMIPTLVLVRKGFDMFPGQMPLMVSNTWDADIYLFDKVTEFQRPKITRGNKAK